jgi:putative acetyltransferase
MISLVRTDSSDPAFMGLVMLLDTELAIVDGTDHAFYSQFNKIDKIRHVVVVYDKNEPVGCGAIKEFGENMMEVKRMYVTPDKRSKGIASLMLSELEKWAVELNCHSCILETGLRQPDAIRLYTRNGYLRIANYGQYIGVENSVCFEKKLK